MLCPFVAFQLIQNNTWLCINTVEVYRMYMEQVECMEGMEVS